MRNPRLILWLSGCWLGFALPGRAATTAEGFALPEPGHRFEFPRDHGSHPDFKIEWWYVTGHLFGEHGRRFGFQATFFRQAGPLRPPEAAGAFGYRQIFLAHMALLDVETGAFLHDERLNREGWDAFAAGPTLDVRNAEWSLRAADPTAARFELAGGIRAEAAFTLTLTPGKPLVVFGENGVSRKGSDASAASYYLTFSRLQAAGEIALGEKTLAVTGEAWMDHEISSSQLSRGQVGWDWAGIQLRDGREIMLYRLRLSDGSTDPASALAWVDRAGQAVRAPFTWEVIDRWTSPLTGASYPSRVALVTSDPVSHRATRLTLVPLVKSQELTGNLDGIPYWEGACRVLNAQDEEVGSAYLELTGYAEALKL